MIRGLYSSYTGMNAMLMLQDVMANNIANANTAGFKEDFAVLQAFPAQEVFRVETQAAPGEAVAVGPSSGGVLVGQVYTDYAQGSLRETGSATDLALEGEGFFEVIGPGRTGYTRAGNFRVDSSGRLTTATGYLVSGRDGNPIEVGSGKFVVDEQGRVLVGGKEKGAIRVVTFPAQARLIKTGDGVYTCAAPPAEAAGCKISQGFLEQANVDVIRQMVSMMESFRAYESGQRLIKAQDATLERAVNQVGKT